ncbi:hypothetical protein MVLG_05272 [Microbotryum lychnidis-dioicae p1A1 Lamole]|uniref:Uncharacterized protein n=1 Tax=Microbotryum lychnidis-dioicae (strain p1A1 Lamole / MvSl-1064) TaxID=683840 RepID=U5HDR5_USTV1|nr:hypothetical protein MVLG_05272 [Microbotryum lychnidis-dioicae p1A1 Lamole]|eukprot:KDE04244.1 hypothetical protein MVLG_05272 [Microbotryum lychnidis-dioicae p1A1 Lamole]
MITAEHRCHRPTGDHLNYTASTCSLSTQLWSLSKAEGEAMVASVEEKRKEIFFTESSVTLTDVVRDAYSQVSAKPKKRLFSDPSGNSTPNIANRLSYSRPSVPQGASFPRDQPPNALRGSSDTNFRPSFDNGFRSTPPYDTRPLAANRSGNGSMFCIVCGLTSLDHPPFHLCRKFDSDAFTRSSSGALYPKSSNRQVCFAFNNGLHSSDHCDTGRGPS